MDAEERDRIARAWKERIEDPAQQVAWLRQDRLGYVGLMGAGLFWVEPFLTAGSVDGPAKVSIVAWALAFPLLAALVLVTEQELFRGRWGRSVAVSVGKSVGQGAAFVGFVAGFWHVWWPAGAVAVAAGALAIGLHSAGYRRLEEDQASPAAEAAGVSGRDA
jgi:hypothetical protein